MSLNRTLRRGKGAPIHSPKVISQKKVFNVDHIDLKSLTAGPRYKYIKEEFYEGFLNHGSIKIGTVYEYREYWEHNKVIGDHNEGKYVSQKQALNGEYSYEDLQARGY